MPFSKPHPCQPKGAASCVAAFFSELGRYANLFVTALYRKMHARWPFAGHSCDCSRARMMILQTGISLTANETSLLLTGCLPFMMDYVLMRRSSPLVPVMSISLEMVCTQSTGYFISCAILLDTSLWMNIFCFCNVRHDENTQRVSDSLMLFIYPTDCHCFVVPMAKACLHLSLSSFCLPPV